MGTNSISPQLFIRSLLELNVKAPGWNGMNSRLGEAVPGGSAATDLINSLHKAAITYGQLIQRKVDALAVQKAATDIEGHLRTMAVLEQLTMSESDTLIDKLHDVTETYAKSSFV